MSADSGAKLSGGRQRFDCSRVINEDEAESEEGAAALAGGAPARCDLARVPAASEVNKIMQRIAAAEHEEAEQLAEEEQLPEEGGR